MKFKLLLILFVIASQNIMSQEKIEREIDSLIQNNKGVFAVAYKNLCNGKTILINENLKFHAASTMKTPLMLEVLKECDARKLHLNDKILVKNKFKSIVDSSVYSLNKTDDSETELYDKIGQEIELETLLFKMITKSSNLATNILIERVGAENVRNTLAKNHIMGIEFLRGVEDNKAYHKGLNNKVTANGLMDLFEKIANQSILSKNSNDKMLEILRAQEFNEIIPAKLPKNIKIAHKTGWVTGVQHDGGIVFMPNGEKYIVILLSKELTDEKAGVEVLAQISELLYTFTLHQNCR